MLDSHRGWDPGSLTMGNVFAKRLEATLFKTDATRLLVEPNRSIGHAQLFSEFTQNLNDATKQFILGAYYFSHRNRVATWIKNRTKTGQGVLHVSLHTFVSRLNGQTRNAEVGLLYDPRRAAELEFCRAWQAEIQSLRPDLRVRRNYPYLGKADGFTTFLRRRFPAQKYLGIEPSSASGPAGS